jgi:opacity protein-like surface antigen
MPPRWVPVYHRYHVRGVPRYHPRYWGAGVFYYNPPPKGHKVVVVSGNGANGKRTRHKTKPTRVVNRNNSFSIGLNGGTYASGYDSGGGYSDLGLGLMAQWRPVEAVGLEFAWSHTSHSWDEGSERVNSPTQASVNVYAFPWTRVSPYASLGLTWNSRSINDTYWDGRAYQTALVDDTLFGPHVGLGMEFALGDSAALDFEGKYISYVDKDPDDLSAPAAVQGTMGLNFYF